MNLLTKNLLWAAVAGALAAPAAAQDVYLVARAYQQTMPDGAIVTMWGYARDLDGDFNTTEDQGPVSSPGPTIVLPDTATYLTIHLHNELDQPTSVMLPGQRADSMAPVFFVDGEGRRRTRSFTHETAPGTTGIYTWTNPRPGTYTYQSATHPQVQVQMGLYGAMKKDSAPNEAYPGVSYDAQAVLLYSEIDPALHAAVVGGSYGTEAYPSTIDYQPRYFLVNGAPYTESTPAIAAGFRGGRTLLRFINMGLRTHTPVLEDGHLAIVAEDGNLYPHPREQYSVMLAAGKTRDAIFVPAADRTYTVYDRMLDPGMLARLEVASSTTPEAMPDSYSVEEGGTLNVAAPGVLGNDTDPEGGELTAVLVQDATHGDLTLNADGSFDYIPETNFSGTDEFGYRAQGTLPSNVATVTITVTPVNDPPVGADDHATTLEGTAVIIDVLANDDDPDGDELFVSDLSDPPGGTATVNPDQTVTYTPEPGTTSDSFTYAPFDGELAGAPVTVTVDVQSASNTPPVAVDDSAQARRNTPITIPVLVNDIDPDGNIDPASVSITSGPNMGGQVVVNGDGSVTYAPVTNFRGTDTFAYRVSDTAGALSNEATVRVNVR
jgi:FtsP/CotA-like multicopper oxidase with cupredoxin domain